MAANRLLYAVREYGPYDVASARRNRDESIPKLAAKPPVVPPTKEERQSELDQQFNAIGIPMIRKSDGP